MGEAMERAVVSDADAGGSPRRVSGRHLTVGVGALVISLGVLTFALYPDRSPSPPRAEAVPRSAPAQRPAFTRAEETYIQALWPIHGDVERNSVRLSLGRIFYKVGDIGRDELKRRATDALSAFQSARGRLDAL